MVAVSGYKTSYVEQTTDVKTEYGDSSRNNVRLNTS